MELSAISSDRDQQVINHLHDSKDVAAGENQQPFGKSILEISEHHYWLRMFLVITGNHWTEGKDSLAVLSRIHFQFARFVAVACTFLNGYLLIGTVGNRFFPVTLALFLASASVLPAQYCNRLRVNAVLAPAEVAALDGSLKATYIFFAASVITLAATTLLLSVVVAEEDGVGGVIALSLVFPQVYIGLMLSFNMFCLMIDVHTSDAILRELHGWADQRLLTFDQFDQARKQIHARVRSSRLASDFILVPCVASALGIAVTLLLLDNAAHSGHVDDDMSQDNYLWHSLIYSAIILSLTKELIYLFVAFWYVARVNEQADELTVKLSKGFWGKHSVAVADIESEHSPDMHRVTIYMSSMSEPISFSLLFRRVSKLNVLLSAAGLGFTIIVGIIKSSVEAQ